MDGTEGRGQANNREEEDREEEDREEKAQRERNRAMIFVLKRDIASLI